MDGHITVGQFDHDPRRIGDLCRLASQEVAGYVASEGKRCLQGIFHAQERCTRDILVECFDFTMLGPGFADVIVAVHLIRERLGFWTPKDPWPHLSIRGNSVRYRRNQRTPRV